MPVVPRYVQQSVNMNVGSALPIIQQNFETEQRAIQTVAAVNEAYQTAVDKQYYASKRLELNQIAKDTLMTYKQANIAHPAGLVGTGEGHTVYKDILDKKLGAWLEDAPSGTVYRALKNHADELGSEAVLELDAWGKEQTIKNLTTDIGIKAGQLAVNARNGSSWQSQVYELEQLATSLHGAIAPDALEKFRAENLDQIKYGYGLAVNDESPDALQALLEKKEFTDGMSLQTLNALKNQKEEQKKENKLEVLRKISKFVTNFAEFKIDEDKSLALEIGDPASERRQLSARFESFKKERPDLDSIYHPQEIRTKADIVNTLSGGQQMAEVAKWSATLSGQVRTLALPQIFKEDPYVAGALATIDREPAVAKKILEGKKILETNNVSDDDIKKFKSEHESYFKNVNMALKDIKDSEPVLRAVFAWDLKNKTIDTAGDFKKSVEGVFGKKVDLNGTTVLPFKKGNGVFATKADFEFVLENMTQDIIDRYDLAPATATDEPVKPEDFEGAKLFNAGNGIYQIELEYGPGGYGTLMHKNGKPAYFDFSAIYSEILLRPPSAQSPTRNEAPPLGGP